MISSSIESRPGARASGDIVARLVVLVAFFVSSGLVAQQPEGAAPPEALSEQSTNTPAPEEASEDLDSLLGDDGAQPADPTGDGEDINLIEDLLAEGDDALQTAYVYDGGGRRDPFVSLLETIEQSRGPQGPRPEGIPGLLIDEVTLTGVWITPQGPIAQVQSADQAVSYLLREGDRLFDGDVVSISHSRDTGGEIRFRQIVDDPTAPKPFRDVVRKLEP